MQWLYLPGTQEGNMYYSSCLPLWSLHLNHVAAACLQAPFLRPQHYSLQLLVLIQNLPSPFIPVSSDTSFVLLQPIFRRISSPPLTPWGIWPLGVDRNFLALSQSPSLTCLLGHLYFSATHQLADALYTRDHTTNTHVRSWENNSNHRIKHQLNKDKSKYYHLEIP